MPGLLVLFHPPLTSHNLNPNPPLTSRIPLTETFFRPWEEAYKVVNSAASDAAVRPASDAAVHPASDAAVHPASDAAVCPASDAAVHPADLVIELSESDSERLEKLANAVSILSAMKVDGPALTWGHRERGQR